MCRLTVTGRGRRIIGIVLLATAVFMFMTWLRCFYGSMEAYSTGEDMLKQKQWIRAITYFDRSIHWYTPWNPYVEKSAERLWEIGEQAEQEGDLTMALIAFRAIRGGFYSARSFYTPGENWIRRSEARIHEIEKIEKSRRGLQEEPKAGSAETQEVPGPRPGWSVLVVLCFLGWVGAVLAFIQIAFKEGGEPKARLLRGALWVGIAAVCYTVWVIGMFRA